jgi:two-component system, OmpR family, sensor histidine kinase TctE
LSGPPATYALRPLDRLSVALTSRTPNDMTPIATSAPTELRPVLDALNGFLARLSNAMTTVQNFAGNANHQIRTPLTVARTQIAMAAKSVNADLPHPLDRADQALVRIERVLEQLLLLARVQATGSGPLLRTVDVASLASAIAADLLPKAVSQGKDLGYDGPDRAIAVSEEVLLGELLRNLVDNAITHCPADVLITVHVGPVEPDRVWVSVIDTGPAVPESLFRLLQSRLASGVGQGDIRTGTRGLGVHIVAEIAQALRIDLRLERGDNGLGLAWIIGLPTQQTVA